MAYPEANYSRLRMMGGGNGEGGALGGIGQGLAEGLQLAAKMRLERAQAEREGQMTAWAQNPQNPENLLRGAQAKAALAQANIRGTMSVGDAAAIAGYQLPAGANAKRQIPMEQLAPFIEKLAGLKGSAAQLASRPGGGAAGIGGDANAWMPTDLDSKDKDDIKAIEQGLTNLKQVEQQFKSTKADTHGAANLFSNLIPGVGSTTYFQNANPDLAAYQQSTHEAANAYTRATFGRVSTELVNQSQHLMPQAGTDPALAAQKLNELSNTLLGKANAIIQAKRDSGRPDQAEALSQHFNTQWGNLRFFPELDTGKEPSAPGPGEVKSNFMEPQSGQKTTPLSAAPPSAAPAPPAAPAGDPMADLAAFRAQKAAKASQGAPGAAQP